MNNYAIYTIIVLYFYVLQGGISQSCNKYFNKFMGNLNFGEGTCSVTEDCGSSLKYCFKHGFDFDAKPTKIDINFPGRFTTQVLKKFIVLSWLLRSLFIVDDLLQFLGLVGECNYHKWFIVTMGLLGTLFGLGTAACFFMCCMKRFRKHRATQLSGEPCCHENGLNDFHMIPGSVASLVRRYEGK